MAQRICGFVGDFSRPFRSLDCNNLFSSRQTASVGIVLHAHEVMCRRMEVDWSREISLVCKFFVEKLVNYLLLFVCFTFQFYDYSL